MKKINYEAVLYNEIYNIIFNVRFKGKEMIFDGLFPRGTNSNNIMKRLKDSVVLGTL